MNFKSKRKAKTAAFAQARAAAAEAEKVKAEQQAAIVGAYEAGLEVGCKLVAAEFEKEAMKYQTAVPRHIVVGMAKRWQQ